MLRALYDRVVAAAAHPRAEPILWALAFVESSVFPIPVEALMLPMAFARPDRAIRYALGAALFSALGGLAGYAIGYFLYEAVGATIVATYGYDAKYEDFQALFDEWGWWIVFAGGFTPLPYKVITIASGAAALDPAVFFVASIVSRAARFMLEAGLIKLFGPPIRAFIEKRLALVTAVGFILLLGGFVALRYL